MATVNIYHTCPTNPRVATLIRMEDGEDGTQGGEAGMQSGSLKPQIMNNGKYLDIPCYSNIF